MTINEKMFELLKIKGIKAKDLCDFLNINTSTMTTWKSRGTNPPAEFIGPICEFLDISVYEFLGIENPNEIEKLYNQLTPEDKAIVDNIFSRYRNDSPKSYTSKIS